MSMNKKTRSLINTRYEAQRIYYQRREIKKKDQQIDQLTNNWNELEEWLDKIVKITANIDEKMTCKNVLDKMNEIKEGNNVFSRD